MRETKPDMHGVKEGPPDDHGRVRFSLFWFGDRRRGQCFHADPANYPDVTWHSTEDAARDAAWGGR